MTDLADAWDELHAALPDGPPMCVLLTVHRAHNRPAARDLRGPRRDDDARVKSIRRGQGVGPFCARDAGARRALHRLRQRGDRRHALTPHTPRQRPAVRARGRPSGCPGRRPERPTGATGAIEPRWGGRGGVTTGTCPTRPGRGVGWTRAELRTLGTE